MKLLVFVMATFGYFADASGVPIYGLHTESPPQQGMTWLQKDLAIQEPSEHITVCLHMRLHFVYTDPAIVLYIDGTFFACTKGSSLCSTHATSGPARPPPQ